MSIRKLSAGDIIEARCTRCRQVLNHRIVAMVGEKVVRVECNTCGGTHNYYPPPSTKEAKKSAAKAARPAPAAQHSTRKNQTETDRDEWESLKLALHAESAAAYDMNGKYPANAIINHPAFGLGVVRLLVPPNKMQVHFRDGIKLLRCR